MPIGSENRHEKIEIHSKSPMRGVFCTPGRSRQYDSAAEIHSRPPNCKNRVNNKPFLPTGGEIIPRDQ